MIKDRGMKKWQGMMLPEHVRLLGDRRRSLMKTGRPELDEQELQSIQEILEKLMKYSAEADYKLWENGEFQTYRGTITKIDEYNRQIHYIDSFSNRCEPLSIDNIVDISPL
ncbi:YolD-like family protein [Psychrobacillus glaciei]|uniref:YolD-like family protein n=1 Tax=Psychrobacillus glaciei TaxID=2283160 RepID=A0A5J6SPW2_9BACI|nr:YolD-like family protein [Psychrobacillus glaciei]QFF98814.1 YolD-like family protein [Psychrobacillus glaciei]